MVTGSASRSCYKANAVGGSGGDTSVRAVDYVIVGVDKRCRAPTNAIYLGRRGYLPWVFSWPSMRNKAHKSGVVQAVMLYFKDAGDVRQSYWFSEKPKAAMRNTR